MTTHNLLRRDKSKPTESSTLAEHHVMRATHGLAQHTCGSRFYWQPIAGGWRCCTCDPPLAAGMVDCVTHIEFDSLAEWRATRINQMIVAGVADSESDAAAICDIITATWRAQIGRTH